MRCAVLLVFLVGCVIDTYSGNVKVDDPAMPLGNGLTAHYRVQQESCESGYDSDGCTLVTPTRLSASVSSGREAVELGRQDNDGFDANGVGVGTAVVDVTGDDDMTTQFSITVMDVATTSLFVSRKPAMGVGLPDVIAPRIAVLATSHVTIGQHSAAADQTPLAGHVPLMLSPGATTATYHASCDCYDVGATPGALELSSPHGLVELDVVDTSAIHAIQFDNTDVITMTVGAGTDPHQTFLTPTDVDGNPIVGAGPKPTLTIDDPTIAAAAFDDSIDVGRALFVRGLKVGTTEVRITWGSVEKDLVVSVVN